MSQALTYPQIIGRQRKKYSYCYMVLSALVFVLAVAESSTSWDLFTPFAVLTNLLLGAVLWHQYLEFRQGSLLALQGANGEDTIFQLLQSLPVGWSVERNVVFEGVGEIDMLVRSPGGKTFVVEVKSHKCTVRWNGTNLYRIKDGVPVLFEKDFLSTCMKQSLRLRERLGLMYVVPIVVFSQGSVSFPGAKKRGVYVVSRWDLLDLLLWESQRKFAENKCGPDRLAEVTTPSKLASAADEEAKGQGPTTSDTVATKLVSSNDGQNPLSPVHQLHTENSGNLSKSENRDFGDGKFNNSSGTGTGTKTTGAAAGVRNCEIANVICSTKVASLSKSADGASVTDQLINLVDKLNCDDIAPSYLVRLHRCWNCHEPTVHFDWPGRQTWAKAIPPEPVPMSLKWGWSTSRKDFGWADTCLLCGALQGEPVPLTSGGAQTAPLVSVDVLNKLKSARFDNLE